MIVGFLCNWCSYAGADLAGVSRIQSAPNLRSIRVMCSGRVDPTFILRAFELGADGVLVAGCHPGDCHYAEGNYKTHAPGPDAADAAQGQSASTRAASGWSGSRPPRARSGPGW